MLPLASDRTLSRYLLSAASSIKQQLGADFSRESRARLEEAVAVIVRVAQQVDSRDTRASDAQGEYKAVLGAQCDLDAIIAGDGRSRQTSSSVRGVDADRIQAFLQRHPLGGPDVRIARAHLLSGGRCKITALVEQGGARALPDCLVLRQDWEGGATDTTVSDEFALLEQLFLRGVRVPRPLLLETNEEVLGGAFIMVEKIPGVVRGGLYDPPRSRELMLQLAEQLGRIHAIPVSSVEPLLRHIPPQSAADPDDLDAFANLHSRIGLQSKILDTAIDWLRANIALAGDDISLIHNDLGFHNALVDGETLTAVLDWELAKLGHPASDLGYIKHFVERVVPWEEFIARYVEHGGFSIPEQTVRFHAVWNAVRLYGLIMQARQNLEQDRVNDIEITYACADNVMRLISFLGQEVVGAPG